MKKLFGRAAGGTPAPVKKDGAGPLTNKTVQVGPHTVLVEHVLGLGGYGEIYRAVDISSGQRFALKHLRLDQENIGEVQREAKTMARLRGIPNILRLHAVAFAGPKGAETDGFFLLDYCPGTLLDLMGRHKYMLENHTIIHIFGSVCHAVAAMHSQKPPLAHRDLKAENVLMLPDGTWVVCDFGSATSRAQLYETPAEIAAEEEVISKHTTPAYRPPEMWDLQLMRTRIDTKVDVWALGVLLYVLCFGRLPFAGDSKLAIINARYDLPRSGHNRPPQLVTLIPVLLSADPAQRPTCDQLLAQLDSVAQGVMGRSILQPAVAARIAAAAAGPAAAEPADLRPSSSSFSGLASSERRVSSGDQQQQQQQQLQQQPPSDAELRAAQQQFLRAPHSTVEQLRAYQQQQEVAGVQQRRAQEAKLQQLQQQQQQQRPAAGGSRGGGSFWDQDQPASDSPTAAVAAFVQQQQQAADAQGRPSPSRLEQPTDWAHFSSPEQSPSGKAAARPGPPSSSGSIASSAAAAAAAAGLAGSSSVRSAGGVSSSSISVRQRTSSGGLVVGPGGAAATNPQLSAAGQGPRAHAVAVPSSGTSPQGTPPLGSPRGDRASPLEESRSAAAAAGVGSRSGNPFAGERSSSLGLSERSSSGHMRWHPSGQQQQQQQEMQEQELEDPAAAKLSQLQDIKARAAAAAAALAEARAPNTNRRADVVSSNSMGGGSIGSHSDQHSDRDAVMLERQPRPYHMASSSSAGSRTQQQQQQAAWRSAPGLASADTSAVGSPMSPAARSVRSEQAAEQRQQQPHLHRRPSHEQQQQQQHRPSFDQQPSPRGGIAPTASMRSDSSVRSDRSVPIMSMAAAAHDPSIMSEGSIRSEAAAAATPAPEVGAVVAEVRMLRREVQVLGEQNQAFVYRIKQLEEFTVEQTAAMRKLQLLVEELQRKQNHMGASGSGARQQTADGFSTDGGWYNPGHRTPPRDSLDSLR